ncbi:MAG: transposase [Egibacteraceae bacterium]
MCLDPPDNAVVLSADEKTCIPARPPVSPTLPTAPGLVERCELEHRRAGVACLFAALDVRSGQITHEAKDRSRAEDLVAFLEHLDEVAPAGLMLHIVADNGSSHTPEDTRKRLAHPDRKERFVLHHTPTHASWLSQVELFFSILTRRLVKRGELASVPDLVARLGAFIADYTAPAKPFKWTYEGKPLKAA